MAVDSEQRFAQQLKKGVLEMLVLQLLADQPGHGYELIVRLRKAGGGNLAVGISPLAAGLCRSLPAAQLASPPRLQRIRPFPAAERIGFTAFSSSCSTFCWHLPSPF